MKLKLFSIMTFLAYQTTFAGVETDWSYTDLKAPKYWSEINTKYSACAGSNQSPINIEKTVKAELPPLEFDYNGYTKSIINKEHTVEILFNDGNFLTLDGQRFQLKQFHLHSPSENTIQGKSFPMEMHLFHVSENGELAVVAIMFEEGSANENLTMLWKELPKKVGEFTKLANHNIASAFLPKNLDYYRYNGSLTTPPCTEGVHWIVLKDIQQASAKQIKAFVDLMLHSNNRPVQPQNARLVLE